MGVNSILNWENVLLTGAEQVHQGLISSSEKLATKLETQFPQQSAQIEAAEKNVLNTITYGVNNNGGFSKIIQTKYGEDANTVIANLSGASVDSLTNQEATDTTTLEGYIGQPGSSNLGGIYNAVGGLSRQTLGQACFAEGTPQSVGAANQLVLQINNVLGRWVASGSSQPSVSDLT